MTRTLIVLVFVMVLAGCSESISRPWEHTQKSQSTTESPEILQIPMDSVDTTTPLRIGLLLPLSGPHADLGKGMATAAQMALFDVGGENLSLILKDTAQGSHNAMQGALNDGAQIILGPVFAADVQAVAPLAKTAGVFLVAFSTDWTLANMENIFIMGFTPFDQVDRVAHYAKVQNLNRVAVLATDDTYGHATAEAWVRAARRVGLSKASIGFFAPNGAQAAVEALAHATPPPDAVFMPIGGAMARRVSGLLTRSGFPPQTLPRFGTGLWEDATLARDASLDGGRFAAPDPTQRKAFESRFIALQGKPPPRLASLTYDAVALAAALGRIGSLGYTKETLTNPNGFAGLDGVFRFKTNGLAERKLAILTFSHGKIVPLDPAVQTFVTQ